MEIYVGGKPGRPRRILILTAVALTGTLALAWLQVHAARAFGREQPVGDTPLRVRLPRGWRVDPKVPQQFVLPVREQIAQRGGLRYERRVRFAYEQRPVFQPPETLLKSLGVGVARMLRPARIGPYAAAEAQLVEVDSAGRTATILVRCTSLPDGRCIIVLYEPMVELRPADFDILDEICMTMRIDAAALGGSTEEQLHRAGVTFPLEPGWLVVGPHFDEVPGLYVGGELDHMPAWSVGVFRTWLAAGRRPQDLLADLAAERWLQWDLAAALRVTQRRDGATVVALRHPRFGEADEEMPTVWVVSRSASETVILYAYASPSEAARADEAAGRIAEQITFAARPVLPDIEVAWRSGQALAANLRERGAVPRWGREAVQSVYVGKGSFGTERILVSRQARQRNPERGYEGTLIREVDTPRGPERRESGGWTVYGRGGYERSSTFGIAGLQARLEERGTAGGDVTRDIGISGRPPRSFKYTPGPAFVDPPLESIIAGWVARNEAEAAIIECSSTFGPATCTYLLRHLPADGNYPRVLVQADFWPVGRIEAYDDDQAETEYELSPTAEYRRMHEAPRGPRGTGR